MLKNIKIRKKFKCKKKQTQILTMNEEKREKKETKRQTSENDEYGKYLKKREKI